MSGPATTPPRFYDILPDGHDRCENCGEARPYGELESFVMGEDTIAYRCAAGFGCARTLGHAVAEGIAAIREQHGDPFLGAVRPRRPA